MKLSIITICYNNIEGLIKTFDSITSQTFRDNFEWIIVDGNSSDGTKNFLLQQDEDIDIWLSEPDSGVYNAMNKGVTLAHGEYCMFLNSGDELSSPETIQQIWPYLDGTDIVYGDLYVFNPGQKKPDLWRFPGKLRVYDLIVGTLPHPASFTRTERLVESPYSEKYRIVSDWLFFSTQILLKGATYKKIPVIVSKFYNDGLSSKPSVTHKEHRKAYEESFPEPLRQAYDELLPYQSHPIFNRTKRLLKRYIKFKELIRKIIIPSK